MEAAPGSWFIALVPLKACFDKGDFCADFFVIILSVYILVMFAQAIHLPYAP